MKIGILTFHRAYNYGAFLQCYALSQTLKKRNYDVEVIDFTPKSLMKSYEHEKLFSKPRVETNKPVFAYLKHIVYTMLYYPYLMRKSKFDEQRNNAIWGNLNAIPLSDKMVISDKLSSFQDLVCGKYDIIIVGSDAVWNDYQTNCPYVYFLENVDCRHKISFAASAYGMSFDKKTEEQLFRIKNDLYKFSLISCRDSYTEDFVSGLIKRKIDHVCDPTLFLNANDFAPYLTSAKKKLLDAGVDFNKKLIFLMADNNLGKELRKIVNSSNYMIVGIYNYNKYADINISSLTPFEWAAVYRLFTFTVTSYFHCTIFSLLNTIPVVAVDKMTDFSLTHKSKIRDLLERLNLQEFYLKSSETKDRLSENVKNIEQIGKNEKWLENLRASIERERQTGMKFIEAFECLS